MYPILKNNNFAFRMVSNVLTCLWCVGGVNTDGEVMTENRTSESDCPFVGVETDDVDCSVIVNSQSD